MHRPSIPRSYKGAILGLDASVEVKQQLENMLEARAQQKWLRPGVPKLFAMTRKHLRNPRNLVPSIIEFQRNHGYADTKLVIDQFEDQLLYGHTF